MNIMKATLFNQLRCVICTDLTEWNAAKEYRNKYFFEPNNIQDPYTWTFDHRQHKHFVLYKGTKIIGYAHIQLWPENRAALRIIVINEKKHRQNYGKRFMQFIEGWLRLQGYKSIHTESSPEALKFYEKLGYKRMPFNEPDGYESSPDDIAMGKTL
jgi:GNAT superfamily N-acetyltransferase